MTSPPPTVVTRSLPPGTPDPEFVLVEQELRAELAGPYPDAQVTVTTYAPGLLDETADYVMRARVIEDI